MDPIEHPGTNEDVIFIAELSISILLLYREQRFRGYCILSFAPWDATSLESLTAEEYAAFFTDLRTASKAVRQALNPDHMNYELLGNTNPHLHWHIIPRYKSDPRWGRPIWEEYPRNEFKLNRHLLPDPDYRVIIQQIREHLPTKSYRGA